MKLILVTLMTAFALSFAPAAHAAPADQQCIAESKTARDMAGTYTSPSMTLVVHPCGGLYLEWQNDYGMHSAVYQTQTRVPGEGIIARSDPGNTRRLDTSNVLGVKAAERGYIQLITINEITEDSYTYRLRKIS